MHIMSRVFSIFLLSVFLVLASCTKQSADSPNHCNILFKVYHKVDAQKLIFDTVIYKNAVQYIYSVEKLQYYISDIKIFKNRVLAYSGTDVFLIDARSDSVISFSVTPAGGLTPGIYDSVAFFIGVHPLFNVTNGLPVTLDNINMEWPIATGGGYHFLKMEGHYKDGSSLAGFAMHLGENGFQVETGMQCNMEVKPVGDVVFKMTMNVNQWFRDPNTYDFNTDGVFSMGDTLAMTKLSQNGADVFYNNFQ
jgi:hypothetical protein